MCHKQKKEKNIQNKNLHEIQAQRDFRGSKKAHFHFEQNQLPWAYWGKVGRLGNL